MFFVWFYAALPVACRSGQGFNARSFADKPCVTLILVFCRQALCYSQPLRHACRGGWFAVTAVCPFGPSGPSGPPCKVFRDPTCASALIAHRVSGLVCLQGLIASPCTPAPGGTGRRRWSRGSQVGGLEKCGKMFRKSPRFSAERFSKSFATVCPRGNDNRKALRFSFPS